MTKTIKGDLILKRDTIFDESIKVEGNIEGEFNLIVKGNIDAQNIYAWNIVAKNIYALNIDALNIDAMNINAWDIVCISRKKKSKDVKTIAYSIILDRYNRHRKEVMPE
jgi:hypothetical protein